MIGKKIGLRGLPNILGKLSTDNFLQKKDSELVVYIELDKIKPGKYQPRTVFNEGSIEELASSIREQGIIQPIIVRCIQNSYELIAGERRWRAAQLIGLTTIPSIIKNIDEKSIVSFSIIENIQREELNPIDEAYGYKRLKDEFQMTQEEIAKAVGKPRPTVANSLRLLNLANKVQDLLAVHSLERGHAKLLLHLDDINQCKVADIIIHNELTVRETEKLIKRLEGDKKNFTKKELIDFSFINDCQNRLSKFLSSPVTVKLNEEGKGSVVIHIQSKQELEWILKKCSA
jgi:ParB family transcriptional regulator, chromosome partitioning protein